LLTDTIEARAQIGKDIDVLEYPDSRIELRASGVVLPYTIFFDKKSVVNQGAIVENKRLGHVLQIVQELQKKRDNRKGLGRPAHTNTGAAPVQNKPRAGTKSASSLNLVDLVEAIETTTLTSDMTAKPKTTVAVTD
jgi:hypothetical protein